MAMFSLQRRVMWSHFSCSTNSTSHSTHCPPPSSLSIHLGWSVCWFLCYLAFLVRCSLSV